MKKIPVLGGHFALVDDADYARVSAKTWELTTNGYVYCRKRRGGGKREFTLLHRFILNPPDGINIDHRNRNKLDNQRCNLRLATTSQNLCNRGRTRNNTGFKGARFKANRWEAFITKNGRFVYLGRFMSGKDAATAYDIEAVKYFSDFALTNKRLGLL